MIGTVEQDQFVRTHRYTVATTLRADGTPSNSVVFAHCDADTIIFSTTADRVKTRTVANDPRVALTFLDDGAPYGYVTVEGTATVQRDDVLDGHIALMRAIRGARWSPDGYADNLQRDGRVLIRVTPTRVSGVTNR